MIAPGRARVYATLILLLFASVAQAAHDVVLITLDGVRVDEVQRRYLPSTLLLTEESGFLLGKKLSSIAGGGSMTISNTASKSLPGYRAIMKGRYETGCTNNDCPNVQDPTLFDELELIGVPRSDTAVFASWNRVARAVTSRANDLDGTIAFAPFQSPSADPILRADIAALQLKAATDLPRWLNSRWDKYTWEIALRYLRDHEPRFTYLSFVDSDEWAHADRKKEYRNSLLEFDRRFEQLRKLLAKTPGRLERTSFIITTDHGRGRGALWVGHANSIPHSKKVFAMVVPSKDLRSQFKYQPTRTSSYQSQVRATVEELLSPGSELWKLQDRYGPLITRSQRILR